MVQFYNRLRDHVYHRLGQLRKGTVSSGKSALSVRSSAPSAMRMRGKNADFTGGSQLFLRLLVFIQVYQVVRVAEREGAKYFF